MMRCVSNLIILHNYPESSHYQKDYFCSMNFLAHLYLSGDDKEIMLGNLIADSVKGNAILDFNEGVQEGIRLHRRIDHFTDEHPIVQRSKERLRPKYHKFAGVVTDMFYDHFLARDWDHYSEKKPLRHHRNGL